MQLIAEKIAQMQREIISLRRDIANIPSRWQKYGSYIKVRVQGGNTLMTTPVELAGIKNKVTSITEVPLASPVLEATYADGLGYGYVITSGVIGELVWIANASITVDGSTTSGGLTSYIPALTTVWVANVLPVPISGGETFASVYQIYKPAA